MHIALLCFGISSIANVSGTERVFVEMANALTERGHVIYSIWNDEPGVTPFYNFQSSVHQINLGLGKIKVPFQYKVLRELNKGLHINAVNRVDKYKTERLCCKLQENLDIRNIDVVICFEFNSVMVANRLFRGQVPIITMVHASVKDQIASLTPLQRKEASKVDMYQVLMPSFVEEAKALIATNVCCIPNVVPQVEDHEVADLRAVKNTYKILLLGRIEKYRKRPFVAIQAFAKLANKFPNWELCYYGPIMDAEYKNEIDRFVLDHDLQEKVIYGGIVKQPKKILKDGDIFAFPSSEEGFGLALAEANAMGIPGIGFAYARGVNELIIDGTTGYLANNEEEYIKKMEKLMVNKALRVQMGLAAREEMKKYAPDKIWKKWEDLCVLVTKSHEK